MTGGWGESTALARLRAGAAGLGPSERRVAQVLLARADEVVDWSTSELAAAAATSAATVIRACQNLGFRGFQHLRIELARSVPMLPADRVGDPVGAVFDDAIDALRHGRESVDPGAISRAADVLAEAARLVLVGSGFSSPPLQDAAMRFGTVGRSVEAPGDALAQQFAANSLGPRDACFAVSYSGANAHTVAACRAAVERGARVVAVTSFARSPLAKLADVLVVVPPVGAPHGVDPFLSRLNHLVALQAVHALLARRMGSPGADMRRVVADALVEDA